MSTLKIDLQALRSLANIPATYDDKPLEIHIVNWGFYEVDVWNYPAVNQPDWIVYWNATEGLRLNVNGEVLLPSSDFIYVFPPFTRFSGIREKDFIQFFMHFNTPKNFMKVKNEMLSFPSGNFPDLIFQAARASNPIRRSIILKNIAFSILMQIPDSALAPQYDRNFDLRIRKAIEAIDAAPAAPHSIADLSTLACMSVNNFHRRFLAETDHTPKQYILRRRLEQACQLLLGTQLDIDTIALQCGFKNRYHFSKAFKNYFLYSPVAYKKLLTSPSPSTI